MSLSHLLKSANRRLGLSILQNQQGRISSSASYRASQVMHHSNRKIANIENKGSSSSSWLLSLLRGRQYNQQQVFLSKCNLVYTKFYCCFFNTVQLNNRNPSSVRVFIGSEYDMIYFLFFYLSHAVMMLYMNKWVFCWLDYHCLLHIWRFFICLIRLN
jgi:hypothetical protein